MSAIADMRWGPMVPQTAVSGIWIPAFAGMTIEVMAAAVLRNSARPCTAGGQGGNNDAEIFHVFPRHLPVVGGVREHAQPWQLWRRRHQRAAQDRTPARRKER